MVNTEVVVVVVAAVVEEVPLEGVTGANTVVIDLEAIITMTTRIMANKRKCLSHAMLASTR